MRKGKGAFHWYYVVSVIITAAVFILYLPFLFKNVYSNGIGIEFTHAIPSATPTPTTAPIAWPRRLPIFMYHYVEYVQDKGDTIRQSLDITPYTFEKQIETLVAGGYTFLTAKDIGELFDGNVTTIPEKPIVLTFDDGYRDFYTDAFPILKKHNVKATVYVIAGVVDFRNYMTEKQLQEIAASGLVDVGAHTVHHVSLKNMDAATVEKEVRESKQMLEAITGQSVVSFAYPNGSYDEAAMAAVKAAGFTTAVATKPGIENGPSNQYDLVRLRTGGRSGEQLLQYLEQKNFTAW